MYWASQGIILQSADYYLPSVIATFASNFISSHTITWLSATYSECIHYTYNISSYICRREYYILVCKISCIVGEYLLLAHDQLISRAHDQLRKDALTSSLKEWLVIHHCMRAHNTTVLEDFVENLVPIQSDLSI